MCCFKQKTAYEMRISDWSSDVCSSDLILGPDRQCARQAAGVSHQQHLRHSSLAAVHGRLPGRSQAGPEYRLGQQAGGAGRTALVSSVSDRPEPQPRRRQCAGDQSRRSAALDRSEEHTSELQSLMRISYAVFCLKKKKTDQQDVIILKPYRLTHTIKP